MEKITGFLKAITPRTWIIIAIVVVLIIIIVLYIKNRNKQAELDKALDKPRVVVNNITTPAPASSVFPLKQGSRGNEVKVVQSYLNSKGESLVVDGIWGPLTQASVAKVLKVNEISSTLYDTLK